MSEKLIVFKAVRILELLLSDAVQNVLEDLLVLVVHELVYESALALVSPETNKEQSWVLDILQLGTLHNNLVSVGLSNAGHATEHTGELSNSEDVMELCWSGQKLLRGALPKLDGGLDDRLHQVDDLFGVPLDGEESGQDLTVDTLDGLG